jgi:hypothetical protein
MKSTSLNQEMKTHIILGKGHKIGTLKGFIDLKQKVLWMFKYVMLNNHKRSIEPYSTIEGLDI